MHCRQGWHFGKGHFENVVTVSDVLFIFFWLQFTRSPENEHFFLKTSPRFLKIRNRELHFFLSVPEMNLIPPIQGLFNFHWTYEVTTTKYHKPPRERHHHYHKEILNLAPFSHWALKVVSKQTDRRLGSILNTVDIGYSVTWYSVISAMVSVLRWDRFLYTNNYWI